MPAVVASAGRWAHGAGVSTTRVAIYTRLSRDLSDGTQSSTDRQERLCRAHVEARDWVVDEVFCDVDLSAFDRKVSRPA